ncbi:hypothetical protein BDW02DRAFT_24548 [Decorospora gaudefroyi]|uniref:Uncharacterized protein n=1 Tax=Decorospora gaudefroyi TaxID=184978 RepID=A0A6A5KA90_9PLEO|nr:hypothetical protein BDW02DRAFT_24548 [Decorospora gaudefroyi]
MVPVRSKRCRNPGRALLLRFEPKWSTCMALHVFERHRKTIRVLVQQPVLDVVVKGVFGVKRFLRGEVETWDGRSALAQIPQWKVAHGNCRTGNIPRWGCFCARGTYHEAHVLLYGLRRLNNGELEESGIVSNTLTELPFRFSFDSSSNIQQNAKSINLRLGPRGIRIARSQRPGPGTRVSRVITQNRTSVDHSLIGCYW